MFNGHLNIFFKVFKKDFIYLLKKYALNLQDENIWNFQKSGKKEFGTQTVKK